MKFSENLIMRVVRDKALYRQIGRYMAGIEDVTFHHNYSGQIESIEAVYRSEYETVFPRLGFRNGELREYGCECDECTNHSACPHIGALMRCVESVAETTPKTESYEEFMARMQERNEIFNSTNFLDIHKNLGNNRVRPKEAQFCTLEAVLKGEEVSDLRLRFKIGENRLYVIKDLKRFVEDVAAQRYHSYGKEFATSHAAERFDKESKLILDFIQKAMLLRPSGSTRNNDIALDSNNVDRFFDLFSTMPHRAHLNLITRPLAKHPLEMKISKHGNRIRIKYLGDKHFIVGKKGIYFYSDHEVIEETMTMEPTLIRYETHGNQIFEELCHFIRHSNFLFDEKRFAEFDRYVLNPVSAYLRLSGDEVARLDLDDAIELYADMDEDEQVCLRIQALKDGVVLNDAFVALPSSSLNFMRCLDVLQESGGALDEKKSAYRFDLNKSETFSFLSDGLEHLKQYGTVYVSEGLKRLTQKQTQPVQLGLTFKNDLLQIDFSRDDIPQGEIKDVLQAYKRKKRFYRLKNGEYVALIDADFQEAQELLEKTGKSLDDLEQGQVQVNPYRIFMMDALASKYEMDKSLEFQKHLTEIQTIDPKSIPLPTTVQATLRPYQEEGYRWLKSLAHYGFGGILADDMGLGKTLQMIAYFASFDANAKHLVICPSSVLLNWEHELHRFAPHLTTAIIHGTKKERQALLQEEAMVTVTSYDYLRRDVDLYEDKHFDTVVLDEAQYIKNANSQNAKSVKRLQAKQRFALTGTPIENSLAELWSIFDFLMPAYLYKYPYFKKNYEAPIVRSMDAVVSQELKGMVQPFILRRLKGDVLNDLPDKTEVDMIIEFNPEEQKLYYANLAQANEELRDLKNVEETNDIKILSLLTHLRRICCEPRTIYENITTPSSKLEAVVSFMRDLKEDGKQVLLFSSFTSVLDLVAKELDQEGISHHRLDGRVSKKDRQERIASFQQGEVDAFLISLRAGGTGINLTKAEVVIHFDPWWNISAQNQATDRAHRFGQTRNVLVYRFIMKGSIEERIQVLQEKKKQLSDTFVEEAQGDVVTMTKSEIMSLFDMEGI